MYKRLRDLREDRDLTQKQVAEYLSFTHSAYAKIERGERILSAEILIKLSNLYSVSIDYLLGLSDFPDRIIKKKFLLIMSIDN
ncbi:helix-turn-helix transcriptional regulator [Streptococcus agalactiae]|nr:helix-turn-helix transcriptional regulator [Streptococcus agalactiae]